jgi:putative FmdB family regulatory protein
MPTYDYTCLDCRKRFDVFMSYKEYGTRPVFCSHCGSGNVRRKVNRVRVLKGSGTLEDFSNPAALEGLEDDPRAMARMFRKMGSELGEEMPPQFNEIVDRLDAGQSPDEISRSIEDWGGPLGGGDEEHDHAHDVHSHDD